MEEQNEGCRGTIISGLIWLGSGFISIIIMSLLTQKTNAFLLFLYFFLPNLVIFITSFIYQGTDFLKNIIAIFKKPAKANEISKPKTNKNYGRLAIFISILLYGLTGTLLGFWFNELTNLLLIFLGIGTIWGFAVYYLFQKKYFHHEEF